MEDLLCDELVQEILQKLPPSSSSSVSLVSRRWLSLLRSSTASLSLRLLPHHHLPSLSSFLSLHSSLSSLSLRLSPDTHRSDELLLLLSPLCPRLLSLTLSGGVPVSLSSLASLSRASTRLTSLSVNVSRPLRFDWLPGFVSLRELSLAVSGSCGFEVGGESGDDGFVAELGLVKLCVSGIRSDDGGFAWLWRSCRKLEKLELSDCVGIRDEPPSPAFSNCLKGIREIELRTCRTIVDGVLRKLAENCDSLESLLIHDGGSRDGLLRFFSQRRFQLRKLDLRLPLDLHNEHLLAASASFGASLTVVRLRSCCFTGGEGLKALAAAAGATLEELALVNCDIVERQTGLLASLGQSLGKLRKLDLSYNEGLGDKEFASMLISCPGLVELKLGNCKRLTGSALASVAKSCRDLESVDLVNCCGIGPEAVKRFVLGSARLRRVRVEAGKLSDAAGNWAAKKVIEFV